MAFKVTDYIDAKRALDQIATDAQSFEANADRAVEEIARNATSLQAMQSGWAPTVTQIRALVAANPTDEQMQRLEAELDLMIAAFIAKRDRVIAKRDAAQAAG